MSATTGDALQFVISAKDAASAALAKLGQTFDQLTQKTQQHSEATEKETTFLGGFLEALEKNSSASREMVSTTELMTQGSCSPPSRR